MAKAKDAFRTISEVAEWLDTPTHVLRFWESKFTQIKPVKGAGGRRYYRPSDMDLLGGIKQLLHEEGLTIKGTQKLLREKGVKHVATLGLSMTAQAAEDSAVQKPAATKAVIAPEPNDASEAPAQEPGPATEDDDTPIQSALPFDDVPAATPEPATIESAEAREGDAPATIVIDDGIVTEVAQTPEPEPEDEPLSIAGAPAAAPEISETAAFIVDLPALPDEMPAVSPRLLGLAAADADHLKARAADIAPLLDRLAQLRERMRAE